MKYFVLSDQDKDWNSVMRKFITEYTEKGYLKKRYSYEIIGGSQNRFYVTLLAKERLGIEDPRELFNFWYNSKRLQDNAKS